MYDDLIERLRNAAKLSDALTVLLPHSGGNAVAELHREAADAIEELSMKLHGDEAAIAGMKREIERMVVADKPRWIPVTEALPEEFISVQAHMPDAGPYPDIREAYLNCYGEWFFPALREEHPVDYWMPLGSNVKLPEPPKEGRG